MSEAETTEETVDSAEQNGASGEPASEATPDMSEAMAALDAKLDKLYSRLPEEPRQDLSSTLTADEYEVEDEDDDDDQYQWQDPNAQAIDQIYDYLNSEARAKRDDQLEALTEKYDDIEEMGPQIAAVTRELAEEAGNPSLVDNPKLVERVYLSMKAEADAAAETPAEEARGRGARLETDASASGQQDDSEEDKFIRDFGKGRGSSVFG